MPSELVCALIHARQTVMPKRLHAPGPSAEQLAQIFAAATAAPDHGQITPWRFIIIADSARAKLSQVFIQALVARDRAATPPELERAGEKAYRAPLLIVAIGKTEVDDSPINNTEQLISAGCAIQNMLLVATAQGFGSAVTSGKALTSPQLATLLQLAPDEVPLCFISIGTAQNTKTRTGRPAVQSIVSTFC